MTASRSLCIQRLEVRGFRNLGAQLVELGPRFNVLFGENGQGFCRACFATSYEQLIEASNRIERHVQNLAAKK